jgi:solute:Na+ symporter, SSS family
MDGLMMVLSIVYLSIGYYISHSITGLSEYFLAGRSFGIFPLSIALIATQLGGGVILGTSKEAYSIGLYGLLYVASISIGFLLLAGGVASKLRAEQIATTAELFEKKYHSNRLRQISSLISILSLSGLLMAQIVGTRDLMTSLNVYSEPIFWLFWLFIIGYTMMGGLRAVVENDIIQLGFIICVFFGLFFWEVYTVGISHTFAILKSDIGSAHNMSFNRMISMLCIPALYVIIEQDIAQHIFAARSVAIAWLGSLCAAVFMMVFAIIPVYYGMKAAHLSLQIPLNANPLISLFDQTSSPFVTTLIVYGVFAAIISTADALLCAISSHVVQDFKLAAHNRHGVLISRSVMLVVGIAALFMGRYFTNVIDIIVGSYDIPVVTLLVPLMASLFLNKRNTMAAYGSICCGLLFFLLGKSIGFGNLSPELIALFASSAGYVLGYRVGT